MERRDPFISRVRLKNYKSIAACDVRLGPFTVLIGPNGSGKSNLLDALAFLGRAVETTPQQAIEERGGLGAVLRSVPESTDSFGISIGFAVPSRDDLGGWVRGTYGFEIAQGGARESRPFRIRGENCSLETPQGPARFEVRGGSALSVVEGPVFGEVVDPDQLCLQVAGSRRPFSSLRRAN